MPLLTREVERARLDTPLQGENGRGRKVFLQLGCLLNSAGTSICSRPR